MLKRLMVIAVSSFAVGVVSGAPAHSIEDNILYNAVVKLILKYEELAEKVRDLEKRIHRLELVEGEPEVDMREWGRIRVWVNLRGGPGTEYPRILVLRPGEVVEILGRRGKWYRVRTKEGFVGYAHRNYVVEVKK